MTVTGHSMISFNSVSKYYERQPVLKALTLSVSKGEMVFVTGPTGAGKSTLLKLLYLDERPDEGEIVVDGLNLRSLKPSQVPNLRQRIGVVFQDFKLLNNLTIYDNVALALRIRGVGEGEISERVLWALKHVHLRHRADSRPRTLSGGEQQRIVIARAIVAEPTVLLADEPTGNLDPETSLNILRLFRDINIQGTTLVIATHNRDLFRHSGKRVFKLEEGILVGEEVA
ncbi:MAG: cell division ATP-binding protein FtsE [Chloroflexota bacterium]